MVFNKQKAEHEIATMKLTHQFALRMATIICWSVVSSVSILGVFLGARTPISLATLFIVAIILGIVSFSITRSGCL